MTQQLQIVTREDMRSNDMNGHRTTCFYCKEPEGQPHKFKCVCNRRKVRVRYSWEVEAEYPASWGKDDIEFHMNESSWCADNALDSLDDLFSDECSCPVFRGEFVREMGEDDA